MRVHLTIDSNSKLSIEDNRINAINIYLYSCQQQETYLDQSLNRISIPNVGIDSTRRFQF